MTLKEQEIRCLEEAAKLIQENPTDILKISQSLEAKLLGLQNMCFIMSAGNLIYRARNSEKKRFKRVSEISYQQNPEKVNLGRANLLGQPAFYGTKSLKAAAYESKSNQIGGKLVVGSWEATEEILLNTIGKIDLLEASEQKEYSVSPSQDKINRMSFRAREALSIIFTCLTNYKLTNRVYTCSSNPNMNISHFSGNLIGDQRFSQIEGLVYPGSTVDHCGKKVNNFVFLPEVVDKKLKLISATEFEVLDNDRFRVIAQGVPDINGNILWKSGNNHLWPQ